MTKKIFVFFVILSVGLFMACNSDLTSNILENVTNIKQQSTGPFTLNGKNYATLQDAVNALSSKGTKGISSTNTIYLNKDTAGPGAVIDNKELAIDFRGYKYTFTNVTGLQTDVQPKANTFGLGLTNGAKVTLKGLEKINLNDSTKDLTMIYAEGSSTSLEIEDAPKLEVASN